MEAGAKREVPSSSSGYFGLVVMHVEISHRRRGLLPVAVIDGNGI